jgi:hypothetical protein
VSCDSFFAGFLNDLISDHLVHKQIRLPPVVDRTNEMSNKHYVVRPNRFSHELHACFRGSTISFSVVAGYARTDQVLPRVGSSTSFRYNVVYREGFIGSSAVLAAMIVASQDVLARQYDLLVWHADIHRQAHDTWEGHRSRHGTEHLSIVRFDQFSLSKPKEDDGFSYVTDTEWLVIVVQNEHLATEFAICANSNGFDAEDSVTSFHYITQLAQMFLEEDLGITSKI